MDADDNGGISPVPSKKEKPVVEETFVHQISHEMLEILAPNGEGDYILDKISNMTEDEAVEIIQTSRKPIGHFYAS